MCARWYFGGGRVSERQRQFFLLFFKMLSIQLYTSVDADAGYIFLKKIKLSAIAAVAAAAALRGEMERKRATSDLPYLG